MTCMYHNENDVSMNEISAIGTIDLFCDPMEIQSPFQIVWENVSSKNIAEILLHKMKASSENVAMVSLFVIIAAIFFTSRLTLKLEKNGDIEKSLQLLTIVR
jgi:hypothetical protein